MHDSTPYPPSPQNVPADLTQAKVSYQRQVWLAMSGLLAFVVFYLALTASFTFITYNSFYEVYHGRSNAINILVAFMSLLLSIFLIKSLFTVRKFGEPGGIEVTADMEPKLFDFLHRLADEIGAPKPHRVFLTPEVNAAVFYDLSLVNLLFPSKKNLIIGLGLVNVLNLGELKAVLAHEFGHFAQGAMAVGRWVYIAQQVIAHMVAVRDWLDSIVRFISRIDLRVAWIGWLLSLMIWSIRSLMDTLFSVVIISERALSREMEFNADLVAVSVTGSDALVHALHKLQAADEAWRTTLDIAKQEASRGKCIDDLFIAQNEAITKISTILNDKAYGVVPERNGEQASAFRVFSEQTAMPPQMWSTHPSNRDRENNVKNTYVSANIDERSAWALFFNADDLKQKISLSFYNAEKVDSLENVSANEVVATCFNKASYDSQYRGMYLSRSPIRNFESVDEVFNKSELNSAPDSLNTLYPESIVAELDLARNLDAEKYTLQALQTGDLKPSGGVIRHRGEELKKSDIGDALKQIEKEIKVVAERLKVHDANCRMAHLYLAKNIGNGWEVYLKSLIRLLHFSDHLHAIVINEQALLVNTWQVITADGQIGYFEKRRMVKVCKQVQNKMREVNKFTQQLALPDTILEATGIENWQKQVPKFDIADVTNSNWGEWCSAASDVMGNLAYALSLVRSSALETLISSEKEVEIYAFKDDIDHNEEINDVKAAPNAAIVPSDYPILLPGAEHVLQTKLDLWNRFQLAHGIGPTLLRLIISLGIVGGTIYSGYIGSLMI